MTNPPPPPGGYPPPPGGYPPPQGGFPPQQGGFPQQPPPQQPQGGYPPPPPPGGGYPPPPPPGGAAGYPPPPGAPGGPGFPPPGYPAAGGPGGFGAAYSVGDAFSWAWNKFTKNAAALIVPTLVYGVIVAVIGGIAWGLALAMATSSETTYGEYSVSTSVSFGAGSIFVIILGVLVLLVVGGAIASAYVSGLLEIANGQPVTIGSFFKPRNVGSVIVASLIIGVAYSIGSLCFIGGLVVALFAMFAIPALLDRNLSPIDAIKASFDVVKDNFGPAILAFLVAGVLMFVGSFCIIGTLVTFPVAELVLIYTWRRLTGGPVAPLTP